MLGTTPEMCHRGAAPEHHSERDKQCGARALWLSERQSHGPLDQDQDPRQDSRP